MLSATQQVTALSMSLYWASVSNNSAPVHVSLALYGPPTCGAQGDSQLLATSTVYAFPAGALQEGPQLLILALVQPLIVAPGNYSVLAEVDSPSLLVVTGTTAPGYPSLVADCYTRNAYNFSHANFPNTTFLATYQPGQDTLAEIVGTACSAGTAPTPLPTCVPLPFSTYPANPAAAVSCSGGAAPLYSNSYSNAAAFNVEAGGSPGVVRLTPLPVAQTQTVYAVSLLVHPETSAASTYTFRAALYAQSTASPTAFSLLAQSAQTPVPGSALSGLFTSLYLPLLFPVTVAAGTALYLEAVYDQPGLVLVFDTTGGSYTGGALTSNQSAPAALVATSVGAPDISAGLLGCPASVAQSSTGGVGPTGGGCSGAVVVNGPAADSTVQYFWPADQLLGSTRVLSATQQVTALSMSLYWASVSNNSAPVHVSLALYGPPSCGDVGDSQLLATTSVYTYAAGALTDSVGPVSLLLPLVAPVTVAPGSYTVLMETDNSSLLVTTAATTAGAASLMADSYTRNAYNYSRASFPNATHLVTYYVGQDTLAQIIGTTCATGATTTPLPTCIPRAFAVYPSNPAAALPCSGASLLYSNSFDAGSAFQVEGGAANGSVRLTPILVAQTQTIYSVALLVHPETSATPTYAFRPSLYTQTGANTFSLLAQTAQTSVAGSVLAGQFTELYFPLLTPLLVQAGTVVYLNRLVDQPGIFLVFNPVGGTYSSSQALSSAQSAPTSLTTTAGGGMDASRGLLGCAAVLPTQSSSLCILLYSLPGTVDYPFSVSYQLSFNYTLAPVSTSAGTAVTLLAGVGTRTFTNRFGATASTALTLISSLPSSTGPLLYLNSVTPFDASGLTFALASPTQLPGGNPWRYVSLVTVFSSQGVLVENGTGVLDPQGQAFSAGVAGVSNLTIGASNVNTLAANYAQCLAPITFVNGLRTPTQPSASNGGTTVDYSYAIGDGLTYSVQTNLTLTTISGFATSTDQLGNPYQSLSFVTGSRLYTHLASGQSVLSTVNGFTPAFGNPPGDQRFYPYSLLAASPGVYNANNAPFLDSEGFLFVVNPAVPALGASVGSTPAYISVQVHLGGVLSASVVLTESNVATNPPLASLQRQTYTFR